MADRGSMRRRGVTDSRNTASAARIRKPTHAISVLALPVAGGTPVSVGGWVSSTTTFVDRARGVAAAPGAWLAATVATGVGVGAGAVRLLSMLAEQMTSAPPPFV